MEKSDSNFKAKCRKRALRRHVDTDVERPHEADFYLRGSFTDLEAVKALVDELHKRYGEDDPEGRLFIPLEIMMQVLVGVSCHRGNILRMNAEAPDCLVIKAEGDSLEPLLDALCDCFPSLNIEIREKLI